MRCLTATYENKQIEHGAFLLSTLAPHLTELGNVFPVGCFNFLQMKASIELRINKFSDAAAKSDLKANCKKFDSELGELSTPDDLADSCVKRHGVLEGHRMIRNLIIPIHKMGGRSECTNYRSISLLRLPGRVKRMQRCRKNN